MPKFPVDAPLDRVLKAPERLGFVRVRSGNHIALVRQNADGATTPMMPPGHPKLKGSTLRTALTQAGIERDDFLAAYETI